MEERILKRLDIIESDNHGFHNNFTDVEASLKLVDYEKEVRF